MANVTRPQALPQRRPLAALAWRLRSWVRDRDRELLLLLALVAVGMVAQGLNMFNYPAFKDDEGIYSGQAWAVLRQGQLSPYTYFYDHAPAGWILIAAWMGITGGPHMFGSAIDSGRVLMLLLHLAMIPMLYHVARKLGCGAGTAVFAALLFSLSPLALYYQRLVLLDTIMLFWALLSLDLLLDGWGRLSRVALSGVCFGLALLSKETAIFLLPAMLLIALYQRWRHQGRFAVAGWLLPMSVVVSWYPLFAALKGELLPAGQSLLFLIFGGSGGTHTSLVDALKWQASRGGGGIFNLNNLFWQLVRTDWVPRDPLLFIGGTTATALNLLRGIRDRRALVAGLLGALPLLYLGRGGIVFDYYVLFAIPFLCLNIALLLASLLNRTPARVASMLAIVLVGALLGGYWMGGKMQPLYWERPNQASWAAITWMKRNLPAQSMIITRDDLWTDLREPGPDGPAFPNVHSHWKVAADPAVRDGIFHGDWRTVDYLIMAPGLKETFTETNDTVALEALGHAQRVRRWEQDGAVVELWKVGKRGATE
jgi:4-amino-4-deoxy-L-arabinose transferase-like glycosyltransferase